MTKAKLVGIVGIGAAAILALTSMVGAQGVPLSATCSGVVGTTASTTNVVTWTANPTGGTGPYTLAWSGAVNGTSSPVAVTYTATGTVVANLQVMDSATSSASSTASSTPNVATTTCSVVITAIPGQNTTTTPPVVVPPPVVQPPRANRPQLRIDPNGQFLARGMTVTSVSSGTIQASVLGINYTINLMTSGQFLRRDGQVIPFTINQQVAVGDEISASGVIDPANPLVVNAGVVRDQSIITVRQDREDNDGDGDHGNHGGNVFVNGTTTVTIPGTSSTVTIDAQTRLKDLLKQLQGLQNLFNNRSGKGNGNGDGGNGGHGDN